MLGRACARSASLDRECEKSHERTRWLERQALESLRRPSKPGARHWIRQVRSLRRRCELSGLRGRLGQACWARLVSPGPAAGPLGALWALGPLVLGSPGLRGPSSPSLPCLVCCVLVLCCVCAWDGRPCQTSLGSERARRRRRRMRKGERAGTNCGKPFRVAG